MRTELFRKGALWIMASILQHRSKIAGCLLLVTGCLVEITGFSYWVDTLIHPPGRWLAFARGAFVVPIGFFLLIKGLEFNAGKNALERIGRVFTAAGCNIIKRMNGVSEGRTTRSVPQMQ